MFYGPFIRGMLSGVPLCRKGKWCAHGMIRHAASVHNFGPQVQLALPQREPISLLGTHWIVGSDNKVNQYHMWLLGTVWMVGIDYE